MAGGSNRMAQAMRNAANEERAMFEKALSMYQPFISAGTSVLPAMQTQAAAPVGESEYYKWRLGEMQRQINQRLASQGLLGSGEAIRRDVGLTQQLTGEETANQWNRQLQLAQLGAGAAGGAGGAAMNTGNTLAGLWQNYGQQQLQQGQASQARTDSLWSSLAQLPFAALGTYGMYKGLSGMGKVPMGYPYGY